MFKVGDKVIEKATGDIGVITRQASKGDCWQDDFHNVWHVLWETGNLAGKELYLHENQMIVVQRGEDTVLRAKVNELEAKLAAIQSKVNFLEAMLYQKANP